MIRTCVKVKLSLNVCLTILPIVSPPRKWREGNTHKKNHTVPLWIKQTSLDFGQKNVTVSMKSDCLHSVIVCFALKGLHHRSSSDDITDEDLNRGEWGCVGARGERGVPIPPLVCRGFKPLTSFTEKYVVVLLLRKGLPLRLFAEGSNLWLRSPVSVCSCISPRGGEVLRLCEVWIRNLAE